MSCIKKFVLSTILITVPYSFASSDESSTNPSPLQDMLDILNPNKGLEPKTFEKEFGQTIVKIEWESNSFNYELHYKRIPDQLMNYFNDPLQEPSGGAVTIHFLNKDGFEVTQRPCYITNFKYDKDENAAICKNSIEAYSIHSTVDEYRRITDISISIN